MSLKKVAENIKTPLFYIGLGLGIGIGLLLFICYIDFMFELSEFLENKENWFK